MYTTNDRVSYKNVLLWTRLVKISYDGVVKRLFINNWDPVFKKRS